MQSVLTDSWKSNEVSYSYKQTEILAVVEIDGDRVENMDPVQNLDLDEFIKIELLPIVGPNTLDAAVALCSKEGYKMCSSVKRVLVGMKMAASLF